MSKISTALKLSLVEQLDTRATPERVKEQIRGALSRGDITLRDIERFTTFKSSTISQVLNDKYEGDTAKLDAALVRYWMNYVAKHSILETRAAAEIHTLLKWAHKKQRIAIIVGDNGRGKTTAVQAYHALHPDDTAYITIDATSRLLEFFEALAKALKIENHMNGPASFRKETIIRALQRREKPLMIIIDEADEIKPRILSSVRTIWGDNEGRCAIVLVGTGKLEQVLERERDLRYMDTRISLRLRVSELEDSDAIMLIKRYPTSLERAEMRDLVNWANRSSRNRGGIRALSNLMANAYDLMQSKEETEITPDMIEQAKGYM